MQDSALLAERDILVAERIIERIVSTDTVGVLLMTQMSVAKTISRSEIEIIL